MDFVVKLYPIWSLSFSIQNLPSPSPPCLMDGFIKDTFIFQVYILHEINIFSLINKLKEFPKNKSKEFNLAPCYFLPLKYFTCPRPGGGGEGKGIAYLMPQHSFCSTSVYEQIQNTYLPPTPRY